MIENGDLGFKPVSEEKKVTSKLPFELSVDADLIPALIEFGDKHGLRSLVQVPEILVAFDKRRGIAVNEQTDKLVQIFQTSRDLLKNVGVDLTKLDLLFRFVSDQNMPIEKIIQLARETGGKDPQATKPWIHAEAGGAVVDFMKRDQTRGISGVVFVYEGDKLAPITKQDRESYPFAAAYYGVKPKPGFQLKDALIGMITLKNPAVSRYEVASIKK